MAQWLAPFPLAATAILLGRVAFAVAQAARNRELELVLGQGVRPKQDDAATFREHPKAQELMGQFGADQIRQRQVLGGDRRRIRGPGREVEDRDQEVAHRRGGSGCGGHQGPEIQNLCLFSVI